MHHCFQIPEIVNSVVDAVATTGYPNLPPAQTRTSAASVARSCRLFYEPSMGALWGCLDSLDLLILCLPSDTWEGNVQGQVVVSLLCAGAVVQRV